MPSRSGARGLRTGNWRAGLLRYYKAAVVVNDTRVARGDVRCCCCCACAPKTPWAAQPRLNCRHRARNEAFARKPGGPIPSIPSRRRRLRPAALPPGRPAYENYTPGWPRAALGCAGLPSQAALESADTTSRLSVQQAGRFGVAWQVGPGWALVRASAAHYRRTGTAGCVREKAAIFYRIGLLGRKGKGEPPCVSLRRR